MISMKFIDSHLHLQDKQYTDHRAAVIQRARQAGVQQFFCNGTCEDDWQHVLELSRKFAEITPFIGVHPWYCDRLSKSWLQELKRLLDSTAAGVGEIGLDRLCNINFDLQKKVFCDQLQLAIQLKRPVVIHCIKHWGALLEIIENIGEALLSLPIMLHSFSGSMETMERLVKLGCTLSFSTRLCDPKQEKLRTVFSKIPMENILLETDSPDQLSSDMGIIDRLNEPSLIVGLYQVCARLKNMDQDSFTNQIWKNGTIFTDQITAG